MVKNTYFISGHLDLTEVEFRDHYTAKIEAALSENAGFVVGDARGTDKLAQAYLCGKTAKVVVYHMLDSPRNNFGFLTKGGYTGDGERDRDMTENSNLDIAWVRPGREKSGTKKNIDRRGKSV